jgi:hypothetical protein
MSDTTLRAVRASGWFPTQDLVILSGITAADLARYMERLAIAPERRFGLEVITDADARSIMAYVDGLRHANTGSRPLGQSPARPSTHSPR